MSPSLKCSNGLEGSKARGRAIPVEDARGRPLISSAAKRTSACSTVLRSAPLRKYWRNRPFGILIGSTLPGAGRITKVHERPQRRGNLGVLGHLGATVPRSVRPPTNSGWTPCRRNRLTRPRIQALLHQALHPVTSMQPTMARMQVDPSAGGLRPSGGGPGVVRCSPGSGSAAGPGCRQARSRPATPSTIAPALSIPPAPSRISDSSIVNTYIDRNMVSPGSRISAGRHGHHQLRGAHPQRHHAGQQADHDGGQRRREPRADAQGLAADEDQVAHDADGRRRKQQLPGWSVP